MKKVILILLLLATLGIQGCKKKNVIPDDVLSEIFHDAFVANAYIGINRMNVDSLEIYEPIFNKYGYTAKDVAYTVGNFSRRKSARLGSVVEKAIDKLEEESKLYNKKVVILDTIRNVAIRTFTKTLYQDTLIEARKRADSTRLRIVIEPIHQGDYSINYQYINEDDIEKYPRRAEFYFEDEHGIRNGYTSITIRKNERVKRTLVSNEERNKRLIIELGRYTNQRNYSSKKRFVKPKTQNLTIKNLSVVYKPHEEDAIDSLFKRYVDVKIFADGFLITKDSLTLSADSTRVESATSDNR